jgi:signal transduction histidine kinase
VTGARRSLRTRLVLTFGITLVLILVGNAAYLLLTGRRTERERLEAAAHQFAVLATPLLGEQFDTYFRSGFFKFRQLVLDLLDRAGDVSALLVVDVEGRVLFDSRHPDRPPDGADPPVLLDGERLRAVRRVQPSELRAPPGADPPLEIVVPYLEDWGRHRFSVIYHVRHASLEGRFRGSVLRALELVAASGLVVTVLALVLGTRLTRPLAALTQGVQEVARGNYSHRLEVRSGDELQAVAEAFNEMGERLQRTMAEMEQRNAELERFTYTVSHDLRSPLVTVSGFISLVEKDIEEGRRDRTHEDIARIRRATQNMDRLLKELLELSRIGRVASAREPVPLRALAEEAAGALAGRLEAAGVSLEIGEDLPVVFGERPRLLEVLQNLIDNAAKFMGGQSDPRVRVGWRQGPEGTVCFVEDNGRGIPPEYHQRVFGLFERLDPRTEGTGIGLALVKRIVEVHGGRVWVESAGAGGTRMCFTLETAPPGAAAAPARTDAG